MPRATRLSGRRASARAPRRSRTRSRSARRPSSATQTIPNSHSSSRHARDHRLVALLEDVERDELGRAARRGRAGRAGSRGRAAHGERTDGRAGRSRRIPADADTAIVWFRRDLRVHDHPPLTRRAARAPTASCPLFVLDPRLLARALRRPARARAFLLGVPARAARGAARPRRAARRARRAAGARAAARSRARSARERGATSPRDVVAVRDGARPARDRGAARGRRRGARATPGNFVADVGEPRTKRGKPYAVFTPFWRAWEQLARRDGPRRAARAARCRPASRAARSRGRALGPDELPSRSPPGEARRARARMHALARATAIDALRRPPRPARGRHVASSRRTCTSAASRRASSRSARATRGGAGAAAFVRQLAWRDFYAHVLLHHPGNARHALPGSACDALEWDGRRRAARGLERGPHRLSRSSTPGCASSRATGWMHNRARLVVGSFLTKDLHLDWRARRGALHAPPAADGDEAQNNGNWQWIASIGVDPAPYFRRMYNPAPSSSATTRTAPTCAAGCPSCATCRSSGSPSRGR